MVECGDYLAIEAKCSGASNNSAAHPRTRKANPLTANPPGYCVDQSKRETWIFGRIRNAAGHTIRNVGYTVIHGKDMPCQLQQETDHREGFDLSLETR